MPAERRIVRVSPEFFDQLDRQLPHQRGPHGEPSATDFETMELPSIIERFAVGFDALPEAIEGLPAIRMTIASGLLAEMYVVYGALVDSKVIELVGLTSVADRDVSDIPTGTARVVELGRALMTRPQVLLLDEPASGQTEAETDAFGALLQQLVSEDGLTVLLVEHDMALVMAVCDHIHVLDFGSIIAEGTPEEIRSNQSVLDAYLGAEGEHV